MTEYTKLTINLIPLAARALDEATAVSGHTKTDALNRAIQFYAFYLRETGAGKQFVVVDAEGLSQQIQLL